jgi:hypothetical protein
MKASNLSRVASAVQHHMHWYSCSYRPCLVHAGIVLFLYNSMFVTVCYFYATEFFFLLELMDKRGKELVPLLMFNPVWCTLHCTDANSKMYGDH